MGKVNATSTYPTFVNYLAPLIDQNKEEDDNNGESEVVNNISAANVQQNLQATINAWINQCIDKVTSFQPKWSTIIVDSGATSHFMCTEEGLPITGSSSKVVLLPNGAEIKALYTTELSFLSLSTKAHYADVLPGLWQKNFAKANYTTIFHPQGEGVSVHKQGSFKLKLFSKPVLQGWRDANGLWRLSHESPTSPVRCTDIKCKGAANVYSLPSIPQTIKYLHGSDGFPTKDAWVRAIDSGH